MPQIPQADGGSQQGQDDGPKQIGKSIESPSGPSGSDVVTTGLAGGSKPAQEDKPGKSLEGESGLAEPPGCW
jgi:hypothetical protein